MSEHHGAGGPRREHFFLAGDPGSAGVRTLIMPDTLITIEGMVHHHAPLTIESILDAATVDADGRILVPMLDILALMRLDADAEIVLVRFRIGTSCALSVRELTRNSDLFIILEVGGATIDHSHCTVVPKLWSVQGGASCAVASLSAISFAMFVGRS